MPRISQVKVASGLGSPAEVIGQDSDSTCFRVMEEIAKSDRETIITWSGGFLLPVSLWLTSVFWPIPLKNIFFHQNLNRVLAANRGRVDPLNFPSKEWA